MQRITYAKTQSDAVAKMLGTYRENDKKERKSKNTAARGMWLPGVPDLNIFGFMFVLLVSTLGCVALHAEP
jgi:hypothetical protein